MVTHSGTPAGPARLRPLNLPRPVAVVATDDPAGPLPTAVTVSARQQRVAEILDTWDVDEEWWRDPLSRRYYQLLLADGSVCTIYQDRISQAWFQQHY